MASPAAEAEQMCRRQICEIEKDAGPEAEIPYPPAWLVGDDAPNRKRRLTDDDSIAHLDVEGGEQLGADDHAMVFEQPMRVDGSAVQSNGSVQREFRLHGAKL